MSETILDEMLAVAIVPPRIPADFQASVMAAVARDAVRDVDQLRGALRHQHRRSIAALRRRLGRECIEALILVGCIFLPVGIGIHALSTPLMALVGIPSSISTGLLALGLSVVVTLSIWMPPNQRMKRSTPISF